MKRGPIVLLVAMLASMSSGCSGKVANAEGCKGSAISVVKSFVAAVESGDSTLYRSCEQPQAPLSADVLQTLASGGWLLNNATPTDQVDPPPAKDEIVIRISAPDQPREGFPPHQSGVLITATSTGSGSYYVTKIVFYASS